jgi:N-acetylglucosaminyl-diphospho-decaprenol L-rhamnosyltransferase
VIRVSPPPSRSPREPGSDPAVTIVLIGHSVREELEPCFASIDDHAGVEVELIYVDNASTDDTRSWLARNRPDVEVIPLEHNVWDSARNEGLARARGKYTMFLDTDARLTPGALPRMISALENNPAWGLLGPRLVYPDGRLQLSCRRFPPFLTPVMRRPPLNRYLEDSKVMRRHLMADLDHDREMAVPYVIGACQVFESQFARTQLGGMDDAIGRGGVADVDWCLRFWSAGRPVVYIPDAVVIHDYRRSSAKRPFSRSALQHLWSFVLLQWRYRGRRRRIAEAEASIDTA